MTVEIAQLAVEVRTADVTRARVELDKLTAAGGQADRAAAQLTRTASGLGSAMRGVVAGLGVSELIRLTDAHTKYTAQLRLATNSANSFAQAQAEVQRIATASQSGIEQTGVLYARISKATKELNISQSRVSEITEVVALSLKASGAGAAESASAMLQLSQAFGSGVLRGEEFNAVNEAAPRLMQALADGIGKPVGALRQMAEQGLLTSKVLANALPKALEEVRKEAAQVQTIAGSFTVLRNAMIEFVGTQAKASGAVGVLTGAVEVLARNLDSLANVALGFAGAKLAHTLLTAGVAAKDAAAGALTHAAALQAERVAAVGMAQASAQQAAASATAAQAEVAETRARVAGLQATEAAIVAARADVVAKLQQTQATINQANAQIVAARAAGAQSFALATLRQGTDALAAAQIRQAALWTELAVLGRQQASVQAATTAAMTAHTAATGVATVAAGAQSVAQAGVTKAVAASGTAMTLARGALAAVGGPIGVITGLLLIGIPAWLAYGNAAKGAGEKTAEAIREGLRSTIKQSTDQVEKLDAAIKRSMDSGFGADSSRVKALQQRRDALQAEVKGALGEIRQMERQANSDAFRNVERDPKFDPNNIRKEQQAALAKFLDANKTKAEKFAAAIANAKAEMGSFFNADVEKRIRSDIFGKEAAPKAQDDGRIDALKLEASQEAAIFQSRNTALQAYRSATLIGDQEFYAGRQAARDEYLATVQRQFAVEKTLLEHQVVSGPADKRVDAQKALNQATADYAEKLRSLSESSAAEELERIGKASALAFEATQKAGKAEADRLTELAAGNDKMREEIALLGATEEAKAAIEAARIRSIRLLKEERLAQLEASGVEDDRLQALREEIRLLAERETLIASRESTRSGVELTEAKVKADSELGKETYEDVKDALSRALQDSKNPARAFADALGNSIYTRVTARLADALATAAVGKDGSSGIWGQLLSAAGNYFMGGSSGMSTNNTGGSLPTAGGRAAGGPTSKGGLYEVNEDGPELFKSGGRTFLMSGDDGMVKPARPMASGGGSAAPVVNVKIDTPPGTSAKVEQRRNSEGGVDIYAKIVEMVTADINGGGGIDDAIKGRYSLGAGGSTPRMSR